MSNSFLISDANLCRASSERFLPAYLVLVSLIETNQLITNRVRLSRLIISHKETLLSAHVSMGSNRPGNCGPASICIGLHNLFLLLSSSFRGRVIEISRMLIPHGLPTYRLHMLRSIINNRLSYGKPYLLVMHKNTPECSPPHIKLSLGKSTI